MELKDFLKKVGGDESDIINYSGKDALEAVKEDGYALRYVKDQTVEICLEAVKEDPFALQYVKDKTVEICLEAVKQNGEALQYVKDQTVEICLEAVKQDGEALQYVKDQTVDICLEAVKQDPLALQYVDKTIFKSEAAELTIEQISEKLGYKIKVVGVRGECYPIKNDIFIETYEELAKIQERVYELRIKTDSAIIKKTVWCISMMLLCPLIYFILLTMVSSSV